MEKVFETKDKKGRMIYLPKERWKHIIREHPLLTNKVEEIEKTIINPSFIKQSSYDENVKFCYTYDKKKEQYLLVAVKYLNSEGFIITSFYVKNIKK